MKKKEGRILVLQKAYSSPLIESHSIQVEQGFAITTIGGTLDGFSKFGYDSEGMVGNSGIGINDFGLDND